MKIKILLVEDILGNIIKSLLDTKNGYDFTIINNGRKAVIETVEHEYDCIIMDLLLPEMSGIRAIKYIREFDKDIPIIALSAVGNFKEAAMKAGANQFIWKPPDFNHLHIMIYELVIDYKSKLSTIDVDDFIIKKNKLRRLSLLKERKAFAGANVDPAIIMEIEDLEKELTSN